jgi:2-polyprenyl-3-methyl-5-hydroxy-6-metoxy-1,4-benzoquinol methylase
MSPSVVEFYQDNVREYFRCQHCALVFVPQRWHLSLVAEKALYDLHENRIDDLGYRQFLTRLCQPLSARLAPHAQGLDFGCGPGPLLAKMFEEQGYTMSLYDPFYADATELLQQSYDFITCTEVVEHFRQPQLMFEQLFGLLKPYGLLGIMTKRVIDVAAFSRWHYKNDPTHICFYSEATLQWLAAKYHRQMELIDKDVALFWASCHR